MQPTNSARATGAGVDEIGRPVIALRLRCPVCNRLVRGARLRVAQRLDVTRTCSIGHRWAVTVEPYDIRPDRALHQIEWNPLPIAA